MRRVLVADDKESSREFVRVALERAGLIVEEAKDGQEALDRLTETTPELVLLDIHMPRLDGFSVLQRIREDARYASIPVVALTASAMQGDRERALSAGFADYLTKPVSLSALRSRVLELLRRDD
jgi:CheY-like chemotaxis protein